MTDPPTSPAGPLLAIVPARGGSKGIPRKNMRLVAGAPLLSYTVDALVESGVADRVLVSSDDPVILRWAERHGVEPHVRGEVLAGDEATISDVAADIADSLDWDGIVGVFQPTSPLRSAVSVSRAVEEFRAGQDASLASCVRESHLFWRDDGDSGPEPLFVARVNRQYARSPVLRETGSIQLVQSAALRDGRQIVTGQHRLFELPEHESLDIDTWEDLAIARRRLERSTIVFRLRANATVGSGHLFHCLQIAEELEDQDLHFLLTDCDPFVAEIIGERGYPVTDETDLATDLAAFGGAASKLIVNDVLDTSEAEVLTERAAGFSVVNVEDLGPGARYADWVVNALYPTGDGAAVNVSGGHDFATLRDEFADVGERTIRDEASRVLITFGGTDPAGLAHRCARLLSATPSLELKVIVGPGARDREFPPGVEVRRHVDDMAREMLEADLMLTSAGRTVYEAAATGTPVVVLAQNAREATHSHLDMDFGVVFLGIGALVDDDHILGVTRRLLDDADLRRELSARLSGSVDSRGSARIAHHIRGMLGGL